MEEAYFKEQIELIDEELFREYINNGKENNNVILKRLFEDRKKRAENLKIKLEIKWDDSKNDRNIVPIWDMVSIISNLLDNGLEAVWDNSAEKRWISLSGSMKGKCVSIEVLNSYDRKIQIINEEIKTTKKDENNHGMGLKIIKQIAEKYGMVMKVNNLQSIINKMDTLLKNLQGEWEGNASEVYAARFAELRPGFVKAKELIDEISQALKSTAQIVEETDNNIAN